jgi:type I restriction-modification system DNA methylase subunit
MFSDLSLKLTEKLSKDTIKKSGVYFTPKNIIEKCMDEVLKYTDGVDLTILEPSCGSCEFICESATRFPDANIDGVEFNTTIYDGIKQL